MNYKTEAIIGKHPKGVIVSDSDFTEGRAQELVKRGLLTPTDGFMAVPEGPTDLDGWKRHAEALADENKKLRMGGGEAALLAENLDLKAVVSNLEAEVKKLEAQVAELSDRVVPIGVHDNLKDQFEQLQRLHKTTVDELEKGKKKKAE
jgi:hypothetical protein